MLVSKRLSTEAISYLLKSMKFMNLHLASQGENKGTSSPGMSDLLVLRPDCFESSASLNTDVKMDNFILGGDRS